MPARYSYLALSLAALLAFSGADAPPSQGMDTYFIDVMGGAATLAVAPERESVLIDTGCPEADGRDPKQIEHVLRQVAGLDHIDQLVITHWRRDHFDGVGGLSKRVWIDQFKDDFHGGPKPDDPPSTSLDRATPCAPTSLPTGSKTARTTPGASPPNSPRIRLTSSTAAT